MGGGDYDAMARARQGIMGGGDGGPRVSDPRAAQAGAGDGNDADYPGGAFGPVRDTSGPAAGDRTAPTPMPSPGMGRRRARPGDRLKALQDAAAAQQKRRVVRLPGLSLAYNADITVELQSLSVQQVMASGIMPGPARQILSAFLERSEELSQVHRDRVGMDNLTDAVIHEDFNGDSVYVYSGMIQLTRTLAILGARQFFFDGEPNEPPIRLTDNEAEADKLYIGVLPDADVEILSGAVWQDLEGQAAGATPFLGTGDADPSVRRGEALLHEAQRAGRT